MKHRPDTDNDDVVDDEIAGVIDETIDTLILLRGRHHVTDAGNRIDAVATLIADARSRLPDLIADARDQANTWAEIANQLGVSRPHAIAHYGLHTRTRRPPIELD
jgi:hypothetical protein